MFSMLTLVGTLILLASTCNAKATSRQDDSHVMDDYYEDYGCGLCWNFCVIEVAGMEDEDYEACLEECDADYYDYYYGYDDDDDEYTRADKQAKVRPEKLKIRQREDDCAPCGDWCWISGGFSYDDYDGCLESCEADYYDNYDEYDYTTAASRQDDDDYYGDYGCDVCWSYCMIAVGGVGGDEDYHDACLEACDSDYYDYYYGEDDDEDERADKQMKARPDQLKIKRREDYSYDDCHSPCEDYCWISGDFDYDDEFDYDGCLESCDADFHDIYEDYVDSRAGKQLQRMRKLKQK